MRRTAQIQALRKGASVAFNPEGKVDDLCHDLCGMNMRVCAAIVENWGDDDFRLPHRKERLNSAFGFG